MNTTYCFYNVYSNNINKTINHYNQEHHYIIWESNCIPFIPKGLPSIKVKLSILGWVLFYKFIRKKLEIFLIYNGSKLVHYTVFSSKNYKYPFMKEYDVQVGPAWTCPSERRHGLLSFAIQTYNMIQNKNIEKYWWICRENNVASRQAIERIGFSLSGTGYRQPILVKRYFGRFLLNSKNE